MGRKCGKEANYNGLNNHETNLRPNIHNAFSRRIQSLIYYNFPDKIQRLKLWKNSLKNISKINENDFIKIAKNYELSGGSIKNIIQHAWLHSKQTKVELDINHIILGIKRELNKEGKIFNKS